MELIRIFFKLVGIVSVVDSSILALCTYIYCKNEATVNRWIVLYIVAIILVFIGLGVYLITR